MYHIGKITNTHGIKGEVKIYNLSDFNRFFVGSHVYVVADNQKIEFVIENVRKQKNVLIVKFKDYDNINDVLSYKGLNLYIDQLEDDDLEEKEYHYQDLIGKAVYTSQNQYVGLVTDLIEVPQGHLLQIAGEIKKNILIPFREEFVGQISEDKIIIFPIEGMI